MCPAFPLAAALWDLLYYLVLVWPWLIVDQDQVDVWPCVPCEQYYIPNLLAPFVETVQHPAPCLGLDYFILIIVYACIPAIAL